MEIKIEKGSAHPISPNHKTRDGRTIFLLMAYDAEGREYHHDHDFYHWDDADALAKKVNDRGYINQDHWGCRVPYGSNAWISDGMEDRWIEDEKYGFI